MLSSIEWCLGVLEFFIAYIEEFASEQLEHISQNTLPSNYGK